jgi:class 3 adenylate cyclase/tetratricopeptide (TPR) repeat protein
MFTLQSRTATVLAADAANYSRAMSADEASALAALGRSRAVIDPRIASNGGRIFSTGGDSVLAEFPSAPAAVACACAIQRELAKPADHGAALRYRIGVHEGRVYPQGVDLLGDAVNIAARLEGLAYPGGVCVSDRIEAQIGDAAFNIEPLGPRALKGIREPIRVYRIRLGEAAPEPDIPGRFSIAVPPFSAAPEAQIWGEGLADDLVAGLSRFSTLSVLGGPQGANAEIPLAARQLHARFALKGALRVAGGRFRLSAQLVEEETGAVVWAERYDYAEADVLTVQDRLIERIVATVVGRLQQTGAERALRKRPENLGAFDLLLQGQHHADRLDPASARRAIAAFEQALALEPDYAPALDMLALMRLRDWALRSGAGSLDEISRIAERALALDPADGWSHLVLGQIDLYAGRLDVADARHKKAHALNPYDARTLALWSPLATYRGRPDEGRDLIERAMSLNPMHPAWYATNLGLACYGAGDYERAAEVYASIAEPQAGPLAGLVAARGQLGDREGAAAAREALLAKAPDFSAARFIANRPFQFSQDREHWLEGLSKGGQTN